MWLHNQWTDLKYIKFYWTVLAHRHAMAWLLAWQALAGIPIGHPNYFFYGHDNFTTDSTIHAISSSLKPSWPVDVQWYRHWPVGPQREFLSGTQIFVDAVTPQPLDHQPQYRESTRIMYGPHPCYVWQPFILTQGLDYHQRALWGGCYRYRGVS